MARDTTHTSAIEARFASVFAHLGVITAYARRRGAHDPDEIAAETMAIAWRRLADVPRDDPRPWLIATARNLVLADHRRRGTRHSDLEGVELAAAEELSSPALDLDPELEVALATLSETDRGRADDRRRRICRRPTGFDPRQPKGPVRRPCGGRRRLPSRASAGSSTGSRSAGPRAGCAT